MAEVARQMGRRAPANASFASMSSSSALPSDEPSLTKMISCRLPQAAMGLTDAPDQFHQHAGFVGRPAATALTKMRSTAFREARLSEVMGMFEAGVGGRALAKGPQPEDAETQHQA